MKFLIPFLGLLLWSQSSFAALLEQTEARTVMRIASMVHGMPKSGYRITVVDPEAKEVSTQELKVKVPHQLKEIYSHPFGGKHEQSV